MADVTDEDSQASLALYDKVLFDGKEYSIRMINRQTGSLLLYPREGGAHEWTTIADVCKLHGDTE